MDSEKPQKGGMGTIIIALVVVSLVGLGVGYTFSVLGLPNSSALPEPDSKPKTAAAAAAKPTDEAAKADPKKKSDAALNVEPSKTTELDAPLPPDPVDESVNLKDYVIGPLPPIITNLAEPSTVWIRLDGFLVIKKNTVTKSSDIGQQIAPLIMSYLKTLKASELQGGIGLSSLKSDINEIVRTASNGDVHSVLLTGFIIE